MSCWYDIGGMTNFTALNCYDCVADVLSRRWGLADGVGGIRGLEGGFSGGRRADPLLLLLLLPPVNVGGLSGLPGLSPRLSLAADVCGLLSVIVCGLL